MQESIGPLTFELELTPEQIAESEKKQIELRKSFGFSPRNAEYGHYLQRKSELENQLALMQKQTVRDLSLEKLVQNEIAECKRILQH